MVKPEFIVGVIGNIITILLCASPAPTFWELVKKKISAEGYNATPHMCQLLCRTLWVFYGILDPIDGLLIITVNSIGVLSQIIYVIIYLVYSPNDKKVKSFILVGLMNIGFPGLAIVLSLLVFHGYARHTFVGIVCAVVTVSMYAAPISVMISVIKTRSVQYMPFIVSLFLLLNAAAWFAFAMFLMDLYIIVPNVIGIISGVAQLVIYMIYKNKSINKVTSSEIIEEVDEEGGINLEELNKAPHEVVVGKRTTSPRRLSSIRNIMRTISTISMSQDHDTHSSYIFVP